MIILKKCHDEHGKYLGMHVIRKVYLTPEYLAKIKADKDDKLGWKEHRKVMKKAGYDIGDADDE